ncbi:ABC transporter ATP-binding protein [Desulfovibrio inopinatus]|uniref:ABC transporter ATP-binding protein n=1 Tax=Desulfovibrio inopinatus TaxID=102109 RepID=UPI0003F645AE|nr:ABC transporter ATP-binding protein [Desulfovibrio inopinatus]
MSEPIASPTPSRRLTIPDITLEHITVGYGDRIILNDISATLPAGKVSVILGGSGGGKSTMLKSILGLLPPKSGHVIVGETDIYNASPPALRRYKQGMGVLFQDGALLGSLTLGENVALPLREHSELNDNEIEIVVRMKLSLVGLEKFIDFFPSQLSGGMRKRAGLARAMVLDPRVLLCDEPTSGLDPITAAELDALILNLNDAFGLTTVVVTHDLDSLHTIADHVVMLNKGKKIFEGSKENMVKSDDPFLKQFLAREASPRDTTS